MARGRAHRQLSRTASRVAVTLKRSDVATPATHTISPPDSTTGTRALEPRHPPRREQILEALGRAAQAERRHPIAGPPGRARAARRPSAARSSTPGSRAGAPSSQRTSRSPNATLPGIASTAPAPARARRKASSRSNRSTPYSAIATSAVRRCRAARCPWSSSASDLVGAPRHAGRQPAGRVVGQPLHDQPRQRRPELAQPSRATPGRRRPATSSTSASSTAASSRRISASASTLSSARRMDVAQRRHQLGPDPVARVASEALLSSSRQVSPRALAVGGRLLARELEQRPHQQPLARAHAEQRPAAGRGRKPVEDRLDLVGGGVPGGDVGAARASASSRGRAVALVARPGLQVPARAGSGRARAGAPRARTPSRAHSSAQWRSSASAASRRP